MTTLSPVRPSQAAAPAGTGKPPIIYLSRTHAQLQQVVRELKTSQYR